MRRIDLRLRVNRATLYGVGSLDGGVYLETTSQSGAQGDPGGFFVSAVVKINSPAWDMISFAFNGGSVRWQFRNIAGNLTFSCSDAGGGIVHSPGVAPVIDTVIGLVGVHDGSRVRLYVQGSQVGDGTAIATDIPTDGHTLYVGRAGLGNGFLDYYGSSYGLGVPSAQDVAQWWSATQRGRRIVDMPSVPASRMWTPQLALGDITDSVGGVVLQRGSPLDQTSIATRSPAWG
jgi:hypothetical protein